VWSLNGARFPGKVGLLAEVLIKTMAMTSIHILHVRRHHQLIPKIGRRWLGVHYIRRTLGRVSPCQSHGHRHSTLFEVPLCWVCVIFFARVVVYEHLCQARRRVRGGVQGGEAHEIFFLHRDDIFLGRHIFRTTYYWDDIFLGPHDI
jgi:hypothetical protein